MNPHNPSEYYHEIIEREIYHNNNSHTLISCIEINNKKMNEDEKNPITLIPEEQKELANIVRMIQRNGTETAMLIIAQYSDPTQIGILENMISNEIMDNDIQVNSFDLSGQAIPLEFLEKQLENLGPSVFSLRNLEMGEITTNMRGIELSVDVVDGINLSREKWFKRLSIPVIIWVDENGFNTLIDKAPDFCAWSRGSFKFNGTE